MSMSHWAEAQRGVAAPQVQILSRAALPSRWGQLTVVSFSLGGRPINDVAFVLGSIEPPTSPVLVRAHSECLTGDVMGSHRCDCRDQLELALETIGRAGTGILLYLRQEGRGIGIANKVRAYALQDQGLDTVDANLSLGFEDDSRSYDVAANMLKALGVRRIRLLSNNPLKVRGLRSEQIDVTEEVPVITAGRPENVKYLATKRQRCNHRL
jgi:GTP cyclohydrolase II